MGLSEAEVRQFADSWIGAWNAHNLEGVMAHYADDVVLTSPTAARLLGDAAGRVTGKEALRDYFSRGLAAYPHLKFELLDVMFGISSVIVTFVNQNGTKTGEFMEFDSHGKVVRVVANYSK